MADNPFHHFPGDGYTPDLTPDEVALHYANLDERADLAELTDKQSSFHVWELLQDHPDYHFLATYDGAIYTYEDGVWVPDGEQRLRELGSQLLGPVFGRNVKDELVERVRADRGIRRETFGSPPRSVAVENGLLDLQQRRLLPHAPHHKALNKLPVAYDPDATCPRWNAFIKESVENGKTDAIQEYVGYTLLEGEMPFARALLTVGGGSNGKSTFLNTIVELLGEDNTTGYSLGNLAHREDYVANMWGSLANIDADVTGGIGHGGMFKKITGGDRKVNARHLYNEPFDFHPTTKQLYSANEVPDTKVDDDAFFRRWLIVEFPVEFTKEELDGPDKDPHLEDDLADELPGILNWALDGLDRLLEQGKFTNEGEIYEKRERWKEWGDTVDKFISNHVDTDPDDDATTKHRTSDVHEAYVAYCRNELDETPESHSTLTNTLKKESGISYSSDYRFNGTKARGVKGFALTYDGDTDDVEAGDAARQSSLSQNSIINSIEDIVAEEEPIEREQVVEKVSRKGVSPDRVEHELEKLLNKKEIYQPSDNGIETT